MSKLTKSGSKEPKAPKASTELKDSNQELPPVETANESPEDKIKSPDSLQGLSDQLLSSDVLNQISFVEKLNEFIQAGKMEADLRSTIAKFLNEQKFYETEKDRIKEACESKEWKVEFVREAKGVKNKFTVKILQSGKTKPETIWVSLIEKGKYEYGVGEFTIGWLTNPNYI